MNRTKSTLRAAIVGCGQVAEAHVQEIRKIPGASLVAVSDRELLMAEQLADRYGIPKYFESFEDLLSEMTPDVVHITTPPQTHFHLGKMAIESGCHAYIEKPFTVYEKDAEELLKLSMKSGKKITVGHNYYFDPPALTLRKLSDEGVIGEPVHVESHYGYNLGGSFGSAIFGDRNHWVHGLPGKLFQNNIDHLLYKITDFVSDETPEIRAFGYKLRPEIYGDIRDDALDELRVMIKGAAVTAYATLSANARPAKHCVRIYGTRNTVYADFTSRVIIIEKDVKLPGSIGRLLQAFGEGIQYIKEGGRNVIRFIHSDYHFFSGLQKLISLFYDSITNDTAVPIHYDIILRIMRMTGTIFQQVDQGSLKR